MCGFVLESEMLWLWSTIFAVEFLEGLFGQQSGNRGNHYDTTQYKQLTFCYMNIKYKQQA